MIILMEQHAVPQDITGFKFKLVGDMTLKQFGELAFGAIMAYLFYASNWNPFLKWPLTIFFGLLGVGLAFFPIEERPLDIWIINFFRAIYHPTYYVWKKDTSGLAFAVPQSTFTDTATAPMTIVTDQPALWPFPKTPEPKPEPQPVTSNQPPAAPSLSIDEITKMRDAKIKELELAQKKLEQPTPPPVPPPSITSGPGITVDQLTAIRTQKAESRSQVSSAELTTKETALNVLIEQNKNLMLQIDELKNKLSSLSGEDTATIQNKIDTLSSQKNDVVSQITALRSEVTTQRVAPISPPEYQTPKVAPTVRVAKPKPRIATIALTELPNVINGVVEDATGTAIDGVILIIKDQAGNSIRAFKTNKVGQFIVSTPLENGTYFLEMEKPNYTFDTLEVTLSGQVLAPLEIKAKPPS